MRASDFRRTHFDSDHSKALFGQLQEFISAVGRVRDTAGARMLAQGSANEFDVIVIGSGMVGMTAATALSGFGQRILLLEQAQDIGGLIYSFSRDGFTCDIGLRYCGMFGHDQTPGRLLDWLSDGAIEFSSVGTIYDILHFPDGFGISVGRPVDACKLEFKERFPDDAAETDTYFEALPGASDAARSVSVERSMPKPVRSAHRLWKKQEDRAMVRPNDQRSHCRGHIRPDDDNGRNHNQGITARFRLCGISRLHRLNLLWGRRGSGRDARSTSVERPSRASRGGVDTICPDFAFYLVRIKVQRN
jgi:hypothetical protein